MKTFYTNAIKHARSHTQRFRIMLAAAKCKSLSDEDYFEALGINRERL